MTADAGLPAVAPESGAGVARAEAERASSRDAALRDRARRVIPAGCTATRTPRPGPRRSPSSSIAGGDAACGTSTGASTWTSCAASGPPSSVSKAIANGYPLAAVVGRDALRDAAQQVFVTGSFWFAAVPMAAALATIEALEAERAIERMVRAGTLLRDGLGRLARAHGLRITQSGPVQLPFRTFAGDVAAGSFDRADVFTGEAARLGVWLHPWHNWFLSAAHAEADVHVALERMDAAFAAVRTRFGPELAPETMNGRA